MRMSALSLGLGLVLGFVFVACDDAPAGSGGGGRDTAADGGGTDVPLDTTSDSLGALPDGGSDSGGDVEADGGADAVEDTEADGEDTGLGDAVSDLVGDSGNDLGNEDVSADDTGDEEVGGPCETTLCGPEGVCCEAGTECVEDACLAACATGVRCGEGLLVCCPADNVCLESACTPVGSDCIDSYDCGEGEFCEPTLDACLPQPGTITCQIVPEFDEVEVEIEWALDDEEIISIPVVGDLDFTDGDGESYPEVVVNLARIGGGDWPIGEIAILDGAGGAIRRRIPHAPTADPPTFGSHGRSTVAIGDLTGDTVPDIVYAGRTTSGSNSPIHAVDNVGDWLWTSHDQNGTIIAEQVENGAASLANFDDDPMAEVVFGAMLIDHNGLVVWNQGGVGPTFGSNDGYVGGISAIADLTGDGYPEIVSGRHAWSVSWTPGETAEDVPTVVVSQLWAFGVAANDGYPAIADLDGNGSPEVVLVSDTTVRVLEGATGLLWCGRDPTGVACAENDALRTQALTLEGQSSSNRGGPPTIADFDDDGRPEIGIAGGWAYTVYDVNRPEEVLFQPEGDPAPGPGALFVRWSEETHDFSSNASGSSVFDFQGDGAAEVVYADECNMRVYSGTDGEVQLEIPSSNATIHEYPLVVDVDGDNNSELLIVANIMNSAGNCAHIEDYVPRQGLYVYGGPNDDWVRTRRVWTQHAYHVTNATSNGSVPEVEADNWTTPGLNNYRQNVQGEGVFNAPDLTVGLAAAITSCDDNLLTLQARVANQGALGVPAGVVVDFYSGTDATGTLLGSAETEAPLLPGESVLISLDVDAPPGDEEVDYFVAVDGEGSGAGVECAMDNNGDHLPWFSGCPKD